jgi:hypothetical protein
MVKLNLKPEELIKIKTLAGKNGDEYRFLGYTLNLETAELQDHLSLNYSVDKADEYVLNVILSHYSSAKQVPSAGKLVKFRDLPGGSAYELAFLQRAVQPVAAAFSEKPEALVEAAKALGGKHLTHGDASAEIPALEGIPLVYIVWKADEFSATASVLFDQMACKYLPTEDLAVLGELTTARLRKALQTAVSPEP